MADQTTGVAGFLTDLIQRGAEVALAGKYPNGGANNLPFGFGLAFLLGAAPGCSVCHRGFRFFLLFLSRRRLLVFRLSRA